ncbi:MAG TPA: RcnB family protein [Rhizomicrobium sp.]|nr:RcnB family protein [Rhizomicrobium sp.]
MRKTIVAAATACLLAVTPALAAHHDKSGGGGGGRSSGGGGSRVTHTTTTTHSTSWSGGGGKSTRTVRTSHVTVTRGGHGTRFTHVTSGRGGSHFTANVRSYRRNFNSPRRYRFGSYNRPHGWYAHRWVYGERLPYGWYGRDYWIPNFVNFGLIVPPDGYQWVRDGDDALLVDVDTGEVLQVEYGVFY